MKATPGGELGVLGAGETAGEAGTVPSSRVSLSLCGSSCCYPPEGAPRGPPYTEMERAVQLPDASTQSQLPTLPEEVCWGCQCRNQNSTEQKEKPTNEVNTQTFLPPCTSAQGEPRVQRALPSICCIPSGKIPVPPSSHHWPRPAATPMPTLTGSLHLQGRSREPPARNWACFPGLWAPKDHSPGSICGANTCQAPPGHPTQSVQESPAPGFTLIPQQYFLEGALSIPRTGGWVG